MENNHKCSVCGCEDTFKINKLSDLGYSEYDPQTYVEAYCCKKCYHIDFYLCEEKIAMIEKYKSDKLALEAKLNELNVKLNKKKIEINYDNIVNNLSEAKEKLAKMSIGMNNEDLTIRQHKELQEKIRVFRTTTLQECIDDLEKADKELEIIKNEINSTNLELYNHTHEWGRDGQYERNIYKF